MLVMSRERSSKSLLMLHAAAFAATAVGFARDLVIATQGFEANVRAHVPGAYTQKAVTYFNACCHQAAFSSTR